MSTPRPPRLDVPCLCGSRPWRDVAGVALSDAVYGQTPLVRIDEPALGATIWAKLEYLLPSGSTKDRVAARIVGDAIARGTLQPGDLAVEASSGSTSIALAMICASVGVRFRAVMPTGVSRERVLLIERYGGEIELTPAELGMRGALDRVEQLAAELGAFTSRQFENPLNAEAHRRGTGAELADQLERPLDGFVAGVGTGGTLMGIAAALHDRGWSPTVARALPTTGRLCGGDPEISSAIPGVIDGFSTLYDPQQVDRTIVVPDAAAIDATRELAALGFPVGPSSGLNFAAARLLAAELGPGAHVATVFCDRMERYFSTPLFADLAVAGA